MRKKRSPIKDLPLGVGINKISDGKGVDIFRVRLGTKFTGGKPIIKGFTTLKEAKKFIFGESEKHKSPLTRTGVVAIKEKAGKEAVAGGAKAIHAALDAIRRCEEAGFTLSDAVDYALKHMKKGETKTLQEACDFVVSRKSQDGTSEKHIKGMRSIFKRVCEDLGRKEIHTLTREQIEEWQTDQDDVSLNTRISYARHLNIVFNEAVDRGWCLSNPVAKLKRSSKPNGDVTFWKPEILVKLLAATLKAEPELVAPLAIKAFAGLRTSELLRLTWDRVTFDKIHITAKTAKNRRNRGIPVQPVLAEWLKHAKQAEKVKPSEANESNGTPKPVVPLSDNGWFEAIQRICATAEIKAPPNVLRHSFATYRYHTTKSEAITAYEMGNTPQVVLDWYAAFAIEDHVIENWWKITPKVVEAFNEGRFDLETFTIQEKK